MFLSKPYTPQLILTLFCTFYFKNYQLDVPIYYFILYNLKSDSDPIHLIFIHIQYLI